VNIIKKRKKYKKKIFSVLMLAVWALHFSCPPNLKRCGFER
jgi:hypothetical protein